MRTLDEIFKDLAEGTETLKHCQEVIFITTNFPLQSRSHECQWQLKFYYFPRYINFILLKEH